MEWKKIGAEGWRRKRSSVDGSSVDESVDGSVDGWA